VSKPVAQAPKSLLPALKPAPVSKPVLKVPVPKAAVPVLTPKAPAPKVSVCPTIAPYTQPPSATCAKCYSDINQLVTYLNTASGNVSATLCNGTFDWPNTAYVDDINSGITTLTLSCCGNPGSCIIDGGAPGVGTNISLFYFYNTLTSLDIQGIKFQNIYCSSKNYNCQGGLLWAEEAAMTFKHNTVHNVKSYEVSKFLSE
jgi:hypothetical protein